MDFMIKSFMKESLGRKLFVIANYTVISVMIAIGMIPILNILFMSVSSNKYVLAGEVFLWPKGFTLDAYSFIMSYKAFYGALLISVQRAALGVFISMACTILAAYPLSKEKKDFSHRKFFVWFFIITMIFNGGLIPLYMTVRWTGMFDNMGALVIVPAVQVFNVLLLMNFFRDLPKELEESAFMDGAGHFKILWHIILPLAKPALATLTLFTFVSHWNSWFDGFVFMNRTENYPLQTYLYTIIQVPDFRNLDPETIKIMSKVNQRSIKAAEIFVATLPILIIYPFLQKYFTKGIVLGSVKG